MPARDIKSLLSNVVKSTPKTLESLQESVSSTLSNIENMKNITRTKEK